jgi:hypothetical protein
MLMRGSIPVAVTNAATSAKAVITALPMAKPLPVAAVVLPRLSSASVRSRTLPSMPAISAMPPALSATGPYASVASVMPNVESIPTAATAMPYKPAVPMAIIVAKTTIMTGAAVLSIPTDKPSIMTIAGPPTELSAILRVGV